MTITERFVSSIKYLDEKASPEIICDVIYKVVTFDYVPNSTRANNLTRNGGGIFWMPPKIWCLNFKPQYLQNYSSPTNDFTAFERGASGLSNQFLNCWAGLASDFAPKLCTRGVSGCSSACFKTC